jgi:hypothetical protein
VFETVGAVGSPAPPLAEAAHAKQVAWSGTGIFPLSAQLPLTPEWRRSELVVHGSTTAPASVGMSVHALKSSVLHASAAASDVLHS